MYPKAAAKPITLVTLILLLASSVQGDRVWFGDSKDAHVIDQDYEDHNIFVVNGTTVSLENGSVITAPDNGDDGEDAIRVEDAIFHAKSGTISGGLGVGGTGVTISTTRDSDYSSGEATFEEGVVVYGGDATRERTTKGGDAVQVLQAGSKATFNGGRFVPGTGCSVKVCGTATGSGVALQVIQGEAIVKGGTFEGVFTNVGGDIELHGCVEYDKDTGKITGQLLDGSDINVVYEGNTPPVIVYECTEKEPAPTAQNSNGAGTMTKTVALASVSLTVFWGIISRVQ